MREATDYMIGPKNFTSFTDDSENKDPVRRVTNIKIVSNGEKAPYYLLWNRVYVSYGPDYDRHTSGGRNRRA